MKFEFIKPLVLGAFLFIISHVQTQTKEYGDIIVQIEEVRNNKGTLYIYLFNNEDSFPTEIESTYKLISSPIDNNSAKVTFKDIPFDKYAIAIHHDENNNGNVDTNFLGIPNENFGASNDAKGFMGPPDFEDAKFELESKSKTIIINMD